MSVVVVASVLPEVTPDLWPYIITASVGAAGAAFARIVRMIENKRDRELIRHVADKHDTEKVEAVAKALARTRWRPWRKPEPDKNQGGVAAIDKPQGNVLERASTSESGDDG